MKPCKGGSKQVREYFKYIVPYFPRSEVWRIIFGRLVSKLTILEQIQQANRSRWVEEIQELAGNAQLEEISKTYQEEMVSRSGNANSTTRWSQSRKTINKLVLDFRTSITEHHIMDGDEIDEKAERERLRRLQDPQNTTFLQREIQTLLGVLQETMKDIQDPNIKMNTLDRFYLAQKQKCDESFVNSKNVEKERREVEKLNQQIPTLEKRAHVMKTEFELEEEALAEELKQLKKEQRDLNTIAKSSMKGNVRTMDVMTDIEIEKNKQHLQQLRHTVELEDNAHRTNLEFLKRKFDSALEELERAQRLENERTKQEEISKAQDKEQFKMNSQKLHALENEFKGLSEWHSNHTSLEDKKKRDLEKIVLLQSLYRKRKAIKLVTEMKAPPLKKKKKKGKKNRAK